MSSVWNRDELAIAEYHRNKLREERRRIKDGEILMVVKNGSPAPHQKKEEGDNDADEDR